jgi:anaerobic magnesium-protoporphyrin IX monomethyl ester cyclase
MFSMKEAALHMAKVLRRNCGFLVAGGPLPTLNPEEFLEDFDVVVVGEAEQTLLDLINAVEKRDALSKVKGIFYREEAQVIRNAQRGFVEDLDTLPFPARDLFDNESYKNHYRKKFGYTSTSIITSRGCPFNCDFCSRAVFGNRFRARSAENVVDEVETVQALGYDRMWFADDCFTLDRKRLLGICDEVIRRRLKVQWECLSRVDTIDTETAQRMKEAGCIRVFFGLESGNDAVLALMQKQATTNKARKAVSVTKSAGIQVGAFFIVGYPGETDDTVLDTLRFASSLPLDYLSFTLPYPIPGTALFERLKGKIRVDKWTEPKHPSFTEHRLIYSSSFSEAKLKFAIFKGAIQFRMRKMLGEKGYRFVGSLFEILTDHVFRVLR